MDLEPTNNGKSNNTVITPDINSKEDSIYHGWFAKRYFLAGTLCFGSIVVFSIMSSMSIAILEMTKNRTTEINGTVCHEPEFNWSSNEVGLIFSVHGNGQILCLVSALIAKKLGGIRTYGLALLTGGSLYVFYPFIARLDFHLLLAARAIHGILDNIIYLSAFEIWSRWAPKNERSKLLAVEFTGVYIGSTISQPISGYLAHLWQWPLIFYAQGGSAIAVSLIVLSLFANEPAYDKWISEHERKLLTQEFKKPTHEKVTYPWKELFMSKPVWALTVGKFCFACGTLFTVICLPLYISDVTKMEVHIIGLISGILNVASIVIVPAAGYLADYIQNKSILNATQLHKTYICTGLVLGAVCLFINAIQTNFTINIILLIFFKILLSLSDLAIQFIPIHIAPRHSSIVAGISSYGFVIGCTLTPMLMGYIVTSHEPFQWSIFMIVIGGLLLAGCGIVMVFGSSEVQSWSRAQDEQIHEPNTEKPLLQCKPA